MLLYSKKHRLTDLESRTVRRRGRSAEPWMAHCLHFDTLPLAFRPRLFCSLIFLNFARNFALSSNFLHASHTSIDPSVCSRDWKRDFFWFFSSISANSFSKSSSSSNLKASSRSWNAANWSWRVTLNKIFNNHITKCQKSCSQKSVWKTEYGPYQGSN